MTIHPYSDGKSSSWLLLSLNLKNFWNQDALFSASVLVESTSYLSYSSLISIINSSSPILLAAETANTGKSTCAFNTSKFFSATLRSILFATIRHGRVERPCWYCSSSYCRALYWVQGSVYERSITYRRHVHLCMCWRKENPRPRFLWAPVIRPGISATDKEKKILISRSSTCTIKHGYKKQTQIDLESL